MDRVRIGVIGAGNIGNTHVRLFTNGECPDFELTAICDIVIEKAEALRAKAYDELAKRGITGQKIEIFKDALDMMDSGLIDAVTVATPHYMHPVYVKEALKRSIHVLSEKPAGVYTKAVREMNEEAAKHPDVVFAMMFNQRTDHVYRKIKEILDSGELGEIKRTNWIITNWYRPQRYYDSGAWRATWSGEGGGVLLNQCPHNLDLWQWLCGMPCKVDAHLHYGKWHDIEVEDDVTAYVEYPNGATGVFVTTTGDAPGTNRLEITCDGGKIVCENGKVTLWKNEIPESEFRVNAPSAFSAPKFSVTQVETDGYNPQHAGVFRAFSDAILRGGKLVADGPEGINGLMISNAMHLSSWLGKPVELPIDEDLFFEELMKRVKTSRRKENIFEEVADTSSSYGGVTDKKDKK